MCQLEGMAVQGQTCILCSRAANPFCSLHSPGVDARAEGDMVLSLWIHNLVLHMNSQPHSPYVSLLPALEAKHVRGKRHLRSKEPRAQMLASLLPEGRHVTWPVSRRIHPALHDLIVPLL